MLRWALDSVLPADAVHSASADDGSTALLAVSTYQLAGGAASLPLPPTTPAAVAPLAPFLPPADAPPGTKRGCVFVVRWAGDAAPTIAATPDLGPAVFDVKWNARVNPRLLGAASSAGTIEFWRPDLTERVAVAELGTATDAAAGTAPSALMVEWLAGGAADSLADEVAVCMSDGTIAVVRVGAGGELAAHERWAAHSFPGTTAGAEVWTVTQQPAAPSVLWSGGDDGAVKAWDRRCVNGPALGARRRPCAYSTYPSSRLPQGGREACRSLQQLDARRRRHAHCVPPSRRLASSPISHG